MFKKFSIVTPSLNQGQFLEQAVKSVIGQEGNFYIDYILADGGSKDNSVDIIKRFDKLIKQGEYPLRCKGVELRWWSESDRGQTSALNKGLKMAKGEICAWINSDDYYAAGALKKIAEIFENNGDVDLVYGNVSHLYDNGDIKPGEALISDFEKNLQEGCQISQQGAFFSKKILKRVGYLDESLQYCMDYDLWLKILKISKARFINDNLAYFRIWEKSKTGSEMYKFKEEEDNIRKKYGGSIINPGAVHRWRYHSALLNGIKRTFPSFFNYCKKIIYKTINLFRY